RGGGALGPGVVGLAAGGALDLRDDVEGARDLVAGELLAAVRDHVVVRGRAAGTELDDRDHLLAPALVGHADDERVEDVGVRLERALDLLREHLLAARVDALRAAPEDRDRAVGLGPREVADHDVAHAAVLEEGASALLRVVPVADRHAPAQGDPADLPAARRQLPTLVVEHDRVGVHAEAHAALDALAAGVDALRAALRRAEV